MPLDPAGADCVRGCPRRKSLRVSSTFPRGQGPDGDTRQASLAHADVTGRTGRSRTTDKSYVSGNIRAPLQSLEFHSNRPQTDAAQAANCWKRALFSRPRTRSVYRRQWLSDPPGTVGLVKRLRSIPENTVGPAPVQRPNVDAMSGPEFEAYVGGVLRYNGYLVEVTKVTGDCGVDIVARRGSQKIAVQ